jgi:uncharacterized protein (UPF0332 family)
MNNCFSDAKSHDGLKTKFFQHYIKTKKLDKELGRLYSQLMDWRQESDYAEFVDFIKEEVAPLMEKVKEFNSIIIQNLKKE